MNVAEYLRDVTPQNVVQLIPPATLQHLLSGFSAAVGAGVALIYPAAYPAKREDLRRLDGKNKEGSRATFRDLCRWWRDEGGCGQNQACREADDDEAMKYFRGSLRDPRVYRCSPLHLWDMTYPLVAGGRVVGVLFGGHLSQAQDDTSR